MIPLEYRLRESVHLDARADGTWRAVSQLPLSVLTVNNAAGRFLHASASSMSVTDIASQFRLSEERAFLLCEYFRRRGILEVRPRRSDSQVAPSVTVIVPTRDRAEDLDECLGAVSRLEYPRERVEVIVVDDGSFDSDAVAQVVAGHGVHLLVNQGNRGQSFSRNRAAQEASGEVIAFLDSDCVADPGWLRELAPYFSWGRVGAAGGRTMGYYGESKLDRYEEVSSPLDMGRHLKIAGRSADTFYLPTCNLLVRRSCFMELDGLREDLDVGEDVDFCWRLRAADNYLVYGPDGVVRHKHRSRLGAMLRRRAEYGTSESMLYALHREKRKSFPKAPAPLATTALCTAALIARRPGLFLTCLVPVVADGMRRSLRLRRSRDDLPTRRIWSSIAREHLAMVYFAYFHLLRYYLIPLVAAGLIVPSIRLLTLVAVLYSASMDYSAKQPRLDFPTYLGYYVAEHAAYQVGVLAGCARSRTFRSYLPVLERPRSI